MGLRDLSISVEFIMRNLPSTRNSDNLLFFETCKLYAQRDGIDIMAATFADVFNGKYPTLPKFESVSRCRRKIQEQHEELRAFPDVEAGRMVQEEKYREYARTF